MKTYPTASYADVFTLSEFVDMCELGVVTDFDGSGNFGWPGGYSGDHPVFPSQVVRGHLPTDEHFTHVHWFNK